MLGQRLKKYLSLLGEVRNGHDPEANKTVLFVNIQQAVRDVKVIVKDLANGDRCEDEANPTNNSGGS